MSGITIKMKTQSYSSHTLRRLADKLIYFINKPMHESAVTSASYISYNHLKYFNFGNNGSENNKKKENKPETQI